MHKHWLDEAWDEYLNWAATSKRTFDKINKLIKDIERNGVAEGIGKPERLKHRDAWSRHIDEKERLVYNIDENNDLSIIECGTHYGDK